MTAVKQLLEEHNQLAKAHGKMVLNTWKQPKEKLVSRIEALRKLGAVPGVTKHKVLADKLIEKEATRKVKDESLLNVSKVAEEEGVNPKVARAKLRRMGRHANEGRWPTFTRNSAEHKELIALLKGSSNAKK